MIGAMISAGIAMVASAAMAVTNLSSPSADPSSGKSSASSRATHDSGATSSGGATPSSSGSPTSSSPATSAVSRTVVNVSLADRGGPKGLGTGGYSPDAMTLSTDHATVPRGPVTFKVTNIGDIDHEMLVLPLEVSQPIGSRPFGGDAKVDDTGKLHHESHAVPDASVSVTMTLAPGRYELVCNHAGHYVSGMYTQLTVT